MPFKASIVCFACMKQAWTEEVAQFEAGLDHGINKGDFAEVFGTAFLRAFIPDIIRAAFCATGIYPFNPDIITPAQMKPNPALFTPSKRSYNPIDPDLYTPSKRMRLLTGSLATSSSSSFLISQTTVTSSHLIFPPVLEAAPPLAEPDWNLIYAPPPESDQTRSMLEEHIAELTTALRRVCPQIQVHNGMLEGAHAQMVVQNLHLEKLQSALKGKESKASKKTDHTKLFPDGKGRHMTNIAFIETLEHAQTMQKEEAAMKGQRKAKRADAKAVKEALEACWQEMKKAHESAVESWKTECKKQTKEGVLKKD
ncbi:hypothetical protein K439DRAFT_1613271 [Ramaria rubella]|nr:hypothetical protein K439DRAFT_1613271 [Ramaria rubella]